MNELTDDDIVDVKIKKSDINLVVWFVPFIALIVGGWMIYQYYAKIGPLVSISFKNSGGLSPKTSVVKFRDVKVGKVEKIEILKKSEGVKVYVRINKDVEPFLNKTTKFWIVKPEINLGKVQGLDALMNGSYIQLYAKLSNDKKKEFIGLSEPPLFFDEEVGKTYKLISPTSYSLNAGTPVYFKNMQVGHVKKVHISKDAKNVEIFIFIKEKYTKFININTRFWNKRNFSISLTDSGINIQSATLSQLLLGGIGFDTKDFRHTTKTSDTFYLYPSKDEAMQKKIGKGKEKFVDFIMRFDDGVGYLNIGASVRLDGFIVGKVKDIISNYETKNLKTKSLVIATIDISTFANGKKPAFFGLKEAVKNGLCAKLEKVNPLVNYMYINLVKDSKKRELIKSGSHYIFPTQKSNFSDITSKVKTFLAKLDKIPIKSTFDSIKKLVDDLDNIASDKHTKDIPKNITVSINKLNNSLDEFSKLLKDYQNGSNFSQKLSKTLKDIDKASKNLSKVLKKVDKKPNSLIFGE